MTVYLLQSTAHPDHTYIGITDNLPARLAAHPPSPRLRRAGNAGESPHTSKHRPWRLVVAIDFHDAEKAFAFERYLKSGSGRAFAARHFW